MKFMNMKRFGMQLFADGDGSGTDGAGASNGNGDGANKNNEPMSFDDFLATEGMQAEFDRRTQVEQYTVFTLSVNFIGI